MSFGRALLNVLAYSVGDMCGAQIVESVMSNPNPKIHGSSRVIRPTNDRRRFGRDCLETETRLRTAFPDSKSKIVKIVIPLKNPLSLLSFLRPLAGEPQFVTGIDLPLHHLSWLDIDGGSQRQRHVHIALRDGFFTADGLDLGRVVHNLTLVN